MTDASETSSDGGDTPSAASSDGGDTPSAASSDDGPAYFVDPDDVESQVFDWGVLKWLNTPGVTGSERFSAGVVKLEPGEGHDRHTHPDSDEILYVLRGEGQQEVADETREVSEGELVFIPEGVEHGTINTGWEPLTLLAVYAPPGPEAQLRESPDSDVVPAGEIPIPENAVPVDESGSSTDGAPADEESADGS